eukprot:m.26770 g.26770  ORF g.26770 m.26770 type:complete len:1008 (+) comp15539_c0_seq2:94-3117(+)
MDENLYSRQLAVLGHEAMAKMQASRVLICGMRGLGVEIAKNVALGGVKGLSIYDPENVVLEDLSAQFFLREADVGKNRAEVSAPRIAELNPYTPIDVITGELTAEVLSSYTVVVLTNSGVEEQLKINDITHANNVCFISARTPGLFGQIFCDFGEKFIVSDLNGEPPISVMVASVTQDSEGVVTCLDETRHGFEDGDHVCFSEVKGMTQLNDAGPLKLKSLGPYQFSIGDTSSFGAYVSGGIVLQKKMPVSQTFKSLRDALQTPEYVLSDFAKWDRPAQLHIGFQALDKVVAAAGVPKPADETAATNMLKFANEINTSWAEKVESVDEKLLKQLVSQASGEVTPLNSVIGGIAAQEVMKACSGKFNPLKQFFYFDALEALPEDREIPAASLQPIGSRYDRQIAIFGKEFQDKLACQKYFMVGAGAIGCELLKNYAMIGLACGDGGKLTVTDMDTIEKSNLNRQFLFRDWDLGKCKSHTAAAAAQVMNPLMNVLAQEVRVGADTEDVYDDKFFDDLDGVTNALDNVDARVYMDRRCVFYKKPLLESGTLGSKGNVQVVLPHLTESYSNTTTNDPPEQSIPICTLKNFPSKIEHTLQWAKDYFVGVFEQAPENINLYLSQPDFVKTTAKQPGFQATETMNQVLDGLKTNKPRNFDDCIRWARTRFDEMFYETIAQLLYNFPADKLTTSGTPFWSGTKRCPKPVQFDASDETHMEFIVSTANLRAEVFGLSGERDPAAFVSVLEKIPACSFVPRAGITIPSDEKEAAKQKEELANAMDTDEVTTIAEQLPTPASLAGFRVKPLEFEKDDDTNFHMDFIRSAANLRASSYDIKPAGKHDAKIIAGKIIPAIATTTALIAGLVSIELYKLVMGNTKIESYKNGFVNIALPFFAFSEPIACPKKQYNKKDWTLWDRFDLKGEMTLQAFLDHFENDESLEITMLSCGVSMLYTFFMQPAKKKQRLAMTLSEIYAEVSKKPIPDHVRFLVFEVCVDDADGEEVDVPYVCYWRGPK